MISFDSKAVSRGGVLIALLLNCSWSLAGDDLLIYSDQRNNGWGDWGWVTHYATNAPVHSGSNAMVFAATGSYQAWWLKHNNIDTALYTNLTMWVHGGAVGGQYIGVNAELGGSAAGLPRLSATAYTNAWRQLTFSLADLGVANKTNLTGLQIWNGGTLQSNYFIDDIRLVAKPAPAVVHIWVNASQTVRAVDARIFGINTAAWDGYLPSASTIPVLNEMGIQALRWPGGSWGDGYHFTNEYAAFQARGYGCVTTNFMKVATNTGAQIYFIANYGSAAPAEAVQWVKHCNLTNQWGVKYWEVGNENFGSWETDFNTNAPFKAHDPWTYAMRFTNYYALMKAADPTIKIGAVAMPGEGAYANNTDHPAINPRTGTTNYGWTPVLLNTLSNLGGSPDFLIAHEYAPNDGDTQNLLWSAKSWSADAASLRQMLTDYLGSSSTNIELVCTENGAGGDRQRTSLVGGLFFADSIGQILQTEFNARLWWDLRNGRSAISSSDPALYGWRNYYDEGVVSGNAEPTNRYPGFFCAKLMKFFARGGDRVVTATSDYPLLAVYAVRRTNGSLSLLCINKSASTPLPASIAITGYRPATNATVYSYGIAQDEAARTNAAATMLDIATNSFNVAGTNLACTFAPYSASVFSMQPLPPTLTNATLNAAGLQMTFDTVWGPTYAVEWNASLTSPSWQVLTNFPGGGTNITFVDGPATNQARYYRVRVP